MKLTILLLLWSALTFGQDTPAIQKPDTTLCESMFPDPASIRRCVKDTGKHRWTCSDPKAALMTSVDGSAHWCHAMPVLRPQLAHEGSDAHDTTVVRKITSDITGAAHRPNAGHNWVHDWDVK